MLIIAQTSYSKPTRAWQRNLCFCYPELSPFSLVLDAGTIHHRRFLDLVLLSAGLGIPPFLYDAVERTRFCLDDYGEIVGNAIIDLRRSGVKIKSIVGDNHPVQVMALAHWSPKSLLKKLEPECGAVRFQAYICHILQLVMKDVFAQSVLLKAFDDAMLEMIAACNISEVVQMTKSHCSVHVVTR
jgi:hypothetical protein